MTKNEARIWAHNLTIESLRRKASALTSAWVTKDRVLTPTQLEKYRAAMNELADKLEVRLKRMEGTNDGPASEGSIRAPGEASEGEAGGGGDELPGAGDDLDGRGDRSGDR